MLRLPLLIVLAAFGANAGSHCFCRIAKSDCGDCNPSCIAQDFGAVASFGTFQLHTDAICTQACDDKLAGIAQDAACSDLAVNLKVPLPWNGEVQSCWHVGTDAPSASGRRQLTCARRLPLRAIRPRANGGESPSMTISGESLRARRQRWRIAMIARRPAWECTRLVRRPARPRRRRASRI
jgi:hypothetical protein